MFVDVSGEVFKVVLKENNGAWLVSYENPCTPKFVSEQELRAYPIIEPPEEYLKYIDKQKNLTDGQRKRLHIIAELVDSEIYITNKKIRNQKVKEIADREQTTVKRIQKLYFRHLAGRSLVEERQIPKKHRHRNRKTLHGRSIPFTILQRKCPCGQPMTLCCYPDTRIRTDT